MIPCQMPGLGGSAHVVWGKPHCANILWEK